MIDSLTSWGKLCQVHWDDFELWTDSTATANTNSKFNTSIHAIYPNPCTSHFKISSNFTIGQKYSANIYSTYGSLIKEVSFLGAESIIINTREIEAGNYLVNILNSEGKIIFVEKLSVQ